MRVSCPNCQTEYNVPDAALAGRTRKLRCANCDTQFQAGPLPEPPEATPPPAPIRAPAPQTAPPLAAAAFPAPAPPPPPEDDWSRPAATPYQPATTSVTDNIRPFPESGFANPYAPPIPPRPEQPDPLEARNIADRESFAALLESSRQAGAQEPDETTVANRRSALRPWLLSILVLLLIIGLILLERTTIMAAWPPSIRLFEALGLK